MTCSTAALLAMLLFGAASVRAADAPETATNPAVLEKGGEVFEKWCAPCHAAGPGHAGTMALAVRLGRDKSVLLERSDLVDAYVRVIVRMGFRMMPPFKETEISEAELEAVAAFVASGGGKRAIKPQAARP